jgi:hypothetical protein
MGWLFKDTVTTSPEDAKRLASDATNLLSVGEWSPWVHTYAAHKKYSYAQIAALRGDKTGIANLSLLRLGYPQVEMEYQAATRPDEKFLLRQGSEFIGDAHITHILLPTDTGIEALRSDVKSFSEWASEWLQTSATLRLKPGEGPRRILFSTLSQHLSTPREVEAFLEICSLVGINGVNAQVETGQPEQLWKAITDKGFTWTSADHLAPAYQLEGWPKMPTTLTAAAQEGRTPQTWQELIDNYWYDQSMKRARSIWERQPEVARKMVKLANLVDEPGPTPSFIWANCIPAVRESFHEFLRAQGVKPEEFGKRSWDEVDVIGYQPIAQQGIIKLLQRMNIDLEFVTPKGQVAQEGLIHYQQMPGKDGEPPRYRVQVPILKGLRTASTTEKRQYYWTQRFRSYFTRHFYGQAARAAEDLSRQGFFAPDIQTTPNFQAAPMMEARMWDGGLDLFEWGRDGASNTLMVEDWMNDPYRVGFGLTLLNAARQARSQSLAFLIVADWHFRERYLMGLGMGVSTFVDYLFGPLGVIGPTWADRPEGMQERAEMMRATRTVEDDLLATKLRPAQTAILVANSSEINQAYYNACAAETGLRSRAFGGRPLFRRAGLYSALLDAGIPTEIVSETSILEDKALDHYKVLYVADTHVSRATQAAIKEWVRRGGVLWADYTALARDEYDENSPLFDEVFGLSERGALPPASNTEVHDDEVTAVAGGDAAGLADAKADAPAISKAAEQISVLPASGLEAVSFPGSLFRPDWKLSTGKALAKFENGSPAIVLNRFGQGQAIIVGCSALALSPYADFMYNGSPDAQKARHITELAPRLAGIGLPCRVSVPRVNSIVRDGAKQTVLFLINSTDAPQQNVKISLNVPRRIQNAYDQQGKLVNFTQTGNSVELTRDLPTDSGEIIVFK